MHELSGLKHPNVYIATLVGPPPILHKRPLKVATASELQLSVEQQLVVVVLPPIDL